MNLKKDNIDTELDMKKSSLEMYLNTLDEMISRNSPQSSIELIQNEIKKLRKEIKELNENHYKSENSYKAFISYLKNRKKNQKHEQKGSGNSHSGERCGINTAGDKRKQRRGVIVKPRADGVRLIIIKKEGILKGSAH